MDNLTMTIKRLDHLGFSKIIIISTALIATIGLDLGMVVYIILSIMMMYQIAEYYFLRSNFYTKISEQEQNHIRQINFLKKSNADLEDVTKGIVHDLKRPIRSMGSFSQLAKKRLQTDIVNPDEIHEYLDYVVDGASRMSQLLDAIMNYSKINAHDYMKEKVVLDEIMDEVKMNLMDVINNKKANIKTINMPVVFANRFQMMQVLQNLLENAIKYNDNTYPEVVFECEENDQCFVFKVRDNGIGIGEEYKEKVFELFQRLNPNAYEGTGVGLATCKKIIERHHGRIWLESEEGIGTTFFFTLPKARQVSLYKEEHKDYRKPMAC